MSQPTAASASVEFGIAMSPEILIPYEPPPPQIVALRYYRSVMSDYRVRNGIPKTPPVLDCAVPIYVSVTGGAGIPSATRPLPEQVDTAATLRWIAKSDTVVGPPGGDLSWFDMTGSLPWTSFDLWTPQFETDYGYVINQSTSTAELVVRPCLIFDAALGHNMNTRLSLLSITGAEDIEWWLVAVTHPLLGGQQYHTPLDVGNEVRGTMDMPFTVNDSADGRRMTVHRHPESIEAHQDGLSWSIAQTMFTVSGRPIIIRARYGMHPLLEGWGPRNAHLSNPRPVQTRLPLSTNFVLGREFGAVSPVSNAGMHLFEVNYFDHMLSATEASQVLGALSSAYAVSNA